MRTYINSNIADEVIEAAKIDGASEVQILAITPTVVTKTLMPSECSKFFLVVQRNQYASRLITRNKPFIAFMYVLMALLTIACLFPFLLLFMSSITQCWN